MLSGFKQFLMRGNVVDLAVAVVIGAAFTGIVNSVVNGVINPVVGAFGTQDLATYKSCLKGPCTMAGGKVTHGVYILWGSVLSSALNFLITAAVVYFLMVMPMARFLARRAAKQKQAAGEQAATEAEDIVLLREIRDALIHQRAAATLIDQRGPSDGP
ncbi:MAG: large conductance mechanosensitive channel protein MscL [Streptomycetaceae bacterium]|nr:large conductance mechanosensitive channel protein MscL [Streptomycetaceae bacterium]